MRLGTIVPTVSASSWDSVKREITRTLQPVVAGDYPRRTGTRREGANRGMLR